MNNRDRTVVGKVLDEIAIAESLMQNEDLASFLEMRSSSVPYA